MDINGSHMCTDNDGEFGIYAECFEDEEEEGDIMCEEGDFWMRCTGDHT